MTAPTTAPPSKNQVMARPFRAGVQNVDDLPFDVTLSLTASAQQVNPQYEIPSTGFLNSIVILAENTVTGQSVNDVAYKSDGPFNVIQSVQFTDTNNQPILGPLDGFELYLVNKYGGYNFQDDPKMSPVYSATTGTGATAGSFSFVLRIPIQIVPREGLGSLPNKSASTPFKVKTTVAGTSDVYATAPSTTPSLRVRMTPESYWQPQAADLNGNPLSQQPPAVDTTQYWNSTSYVVSAGQMTPFLTSSVGFPLRNLVFVMTDSTGSRTQGDTDFPDPFSLKLEANIITDRIKAVWKDQIAKWYGYSNAVDTAGGRDSGVYPLPYNMDFGPKPGWETRRGYLPTTEAMRFQALGVVAGAGSHTLKVLTNYVAPGPGVTLASITA